MSDRIRVKHKELGHIHSIAASRFDKAIWDKVDAPANNPDGTPVPPEYPKAGVAKKAAKPRKKAAVRRPSNASKSPEPPAASDQPGQTADSEGDS